MKTKEQIIEEAKESYESHFEESNEKSDDPFRGHDVVLDKDQLENEMKEMKEENKEKHQSLEVLREQIEVEAEEALKKTFGEETTVEPKKRMNTDEMREELNKEKEHLTEMANSLKQEKMKNK